MPPSVLLSCLLDFWRSGDRWYVGDETSGFRRPRRVAQEGAGDPPQHRDGRALLFVSRKQHPLLTDVCENPVSCNVAWDHNLESAS
jgi:hypothetical protein